jgi:hypothetical protein
MSLTIEKIQAAIRLIQDIPPRPAIDLFGHDLSTDVAYTFDDCKVLPKSERKMVIVPRSKLQETYRALLDSGIDVRLEPRYGAEPKEENERNT